MVATEGRSHDGLLRIASRRFQGSLAELPWEASVRTFERRRQAFLCQDVT